MRSIPVYNLTVESNHTYLMGSAGIVVHNKAQAEAYATYLRLRKSSGNYGTFYVEAARWFAQNGAMDTALLVLSNLSEIGVGLYTYGEQNRLHGTMTLEAFGRYDAALAFLAADPSSLLWGYTGLETFTYLAELYWLAGRSDEGRSILPANLPLLTNRGGVRDSAGTPAVGGVFLTLYLYALLLSDGETPDLSELGMTDLPGADWNQGLRIKALWPDRYEFLLTVVEPSGEAVFNDNFRSKSGAFYWTQYYQVAGPDEYLSLHPEPGEYQIYMINRTGYERIDSSPSYIPVRVSVFLPTETRTVDSVKLFYIDLPYDAGIYPVGTITVD